MHDEGLAKYRIPSVVMNQPADLVTPVPVPIPTEIPAPPDLSRLPTNILHSGTVETLIGQNEDLMARLKVNIRRNSILEQQIFDQESRIHDLRRQNESLSSQMMIVREKDNVIREKTRKIDSQIHELNSQIELWEMRYAELHGTLEKEDLRLPKLTRKWITGL